MIFSDREQIESFLERFCCKMDENNGFIMIQRKKNIRTLKSLGIQLKTVKGIIRTLKVKHYCSGPELDENSDENLWIFGYEFNQKIIYIKLSDDFEFKAKCVSFHFPDYPMKFPYN